MEYSIKIKNLVVQSIMVSIECFKNKTLLVYSIAIVVFFSACEKPQSKYVCSGGTDCFEVPDDVNLSYGIFDTYSSLSECQANCSSSSNFGYDCINGNCQSVSIGGIYSSLSECQSSCSGEGGICISSAGPSFTDPRDGNVYQTVIIGSQTWMAENLRYMPSVSYGQVGSEITPHYYMYGLYNANFESQSESNYATYGALYNWAAVMAGSASSASIPSNVQGVCPDGWHLPSAQEWQVLVDCAGGVYESGGRLKEAGTTHWESPNTGATNITGFTALPSGVRQQEGFSSATFGGIGKNGYWWSATEEAGAPIIFSLGYQFEGSGMGPSNLDETKAFGRACRCVKD